MSYIKQFIHDHDIHSDKQLKEHLTRLNKSKLDNKNLGLNRALLEIYLRVPRFFGGGEKKALSIIKNIYTISNDEGKKAQEFYNNY